MLRTVALWLLRQLEESLDTDLKKRLDEYERKRDALNADIERWRRELGELDNKLASLQTQRTSVAQEIASVEADLVKTDDEIRSNKNEETQHGTDPVLSDGNALRSDF